MSVIELMAIEAGKQTPSPFTDWDLDCDRQFISKALTDSDWVGRRFIWILRDSGTQLVELNVAAAPCRVKHWATSDLQEQRGYRYFLVHDETVAEISMRRACELIDEKPRLVDSDPVVAIERLLSRYVPAPFDSTPEATLAHWPEWRSYLRREKNPQAKALIELIDGKLNNHCLLVA